MSSPDNAPFRASTPKGRALWGALLHLHLLEKIMSFSSTVQVLKVNEVEKGISPKTQQPWERHTAECMLLADDGSIECVGRLVIPKDLRDKVTVGVFRASFAFVVPTFGDKKGDIIASLTGLLPVVSTKTPAPAPKPVGAPA